MHLKPIMIFSIAFTSLWPAEVHSAEFRAGAFAIDVTPTNFPTQLSGGILPVISTNVLDPLHARSLVLDDGTTRVGLCILDNCLFQREYGDAARALMSQASGIPVERLCVASTHNHSSPALMDCHGAIADTNYARWLLPRLAEGMKRAVERLQPARFGWTVTQAWDYSFNRRWVRRPDRIVVDPFGEKTARVQMNPGHESADVIGPAGPKDPDLSILAVETRDGRPLCVLANFANHYFGVSGPNVSADYFSRFGQKLGQLLYANKGNVNLEGTGEFIGIMSQGTSGDINRFNFAAPRSKIAMDDYAQEMAELAWAAYRTIRFRDAAPLAMRNRDLPMASRYPDAKRLEWAREVVSGMKGRPPKTLPEVYAVQQFWLDENKRRAANVQALRIGDLGIVSASAEVYAISGLKIKAQSPLQPTFWITLANGNDGYIPPPAHFRLGGYTTWATRTSSLETNAEPVIVENLLQMLEEVSGKARRRVVETHGPYAQAVLAENPFAYWRLNEFESNIAHDASGHRRNAIFTGGICHYLPGIEMAPGFSTVKPWVPNPFSGEQINRAVHLVDGNISAELNGLGRNFSVELWFWNGLPTNLRGTTAELVSIGNDEVVGIGGTNQSPGVLFYQSRPNETYMQAGPPLPPRTWTHLVFVKAGSERRLFVNGNPLLTYDHAAPKTPRRLKITIGGRAGQAATLEGKVDEVAVWRRSMTPAEVRQHYALASNIGFNESAAKSKDVLEGLKRRKGQKAAVVPHRP